ncbi:phage tail protein [Flavobacterium pectinovorum]|uniref:Phage tail protein n=1 Tax=Flavobacterium pectinovorum TaxID=29533 RepID=A0A502EXF0_9FLAO|nr:tail fiber protein [Flavobacterium pectinovorum]TPG40841.1 phage tail protein [Flavobacterium pectinovorum]
MEGTMAEVRLFGGNFAPRGWHFCDGTQISISLYDALFALIGTTYGGDGVQTFNLPDLRGRIPVGAGQGPGLSNILLGQSAGSESVTMSTSQMPGHNHVGTATIAPPALAGPGTVGTPTDAILAGLAGAYSSQPGDTSLKAETSAITLAITGQGIPFSIIQPYLSTNYIICMEGVFPTRN